MKKVNMIILLMVVLGLPSWIQAQNNTISLELKTKLPTSEEFFFGWVADMTMLPEGDLIVLDSKKQRLFRFGSFGSLQNVIAKEGKGPGEITGAHAGHLASGPNGKTALFDQRNFRVTFGATNQKPIGGYQFIIFSYE